MQAKQSCISAALPIVVLLAGAADSRAITRRHDRSENLLTWFRRPENGAANLEGGSTNGDSGGGLLLNVDGEYAIAGVLSQAWFGGSGGSVIGQYNTGGVFVRSAPLNESDEEMAEK